MDREQPRRHSWAKRAQPWVTMAAALFVPGLVAYFGAGIQADIAKQQERKAYVDVAVQILSTRPISPDDPLRVWAVELLDHYSPEVKLTPDLRTRLRDADYYSTSPGDQPRAGAWEPLTGSDSQQDSNGNEDP